MRFSHVTALAMALSSSVVVGAAAAPEKKTTILRDTYQKFMMDSQGNMASVPEEAEAEVEADGQAGEPPAARAAAGVSASAASSEAAPPPTGQGGGFKVKRAIPKEAPAAPAEPAVADTAGIEGLDWGTMHDPNDRFCGQFDCYKILGFTHDDRHTVTTKEITKNYRSMSRKYHPDKLSKAQRDAGHAQKLMPYIAKSYEVLTDEDRKMSYDYYFTASREEYTRAFGNSGITGFKYARKTSALLVSFGVLAIFTALTWVVRKNKYDQIKKHVVFAAVNDLALTSGGNSESIHVRKLCLYYIDKIKTGTSATPGAAAGTPASGKKGKKDKGKQALAPSNASAAVGSEEVKDEAALLSKLSDHFGKFAPPTNHTLPKELDRELQKHCFEHFCGVITEHVYSDFGAGYRKPRVPDDLLPYILSIFFFSSLPKTIYSTARWRYRRHAKMEYDESEVLWLTIDTMGLRWDLLNEDQRKACLERKIWEEGALEKWDFEQNVALYGEKKAKKIREYSQRAENGEDMGGDY